MRSRWAWCVLAAVGWITLPRNGLRTARPPRGHGIIGNVYGGWNVTLRGKCGVSYVGRAGATFAAAVTCLRVLEGTPQPRNESVRDAKPSGAQEADLVSEFS